MTFASKLLRQDLQDFQDSVTLLLLACLPSQKSCQSRPMIFWRKPDAKNDKKIAETAKTFHTIL